MFGEKELWNGEESKGNVEEGINLYVNVPTMWNPGVGPFGVEVVKIGWKVRIFLFSIN